MNKNPYIILGVEETSTFEKITEKYKLLKKEYREKMFQEGEAGSKAAKKLQEINEAYDDLKDLLHTTPNTDENDEIRPFGKIEELIKSGDLVEAQRLLDLQTERGAEWHYTQAALYYRQGWLMECKNQLEIALKISPQDDRYISAYQSLITLMVNGQANPTQNPDSPKSYPVDKKMIGANTCSTLCTALLCSQLCCYFFNK